MPKTRSSSGRFESTPTSDNGTPLNLSLPKFWLYKLIFAVFSLAIFSPWIFVAIRKNAVSTITRGVSDFYDSSFTCVPPPAENHTERHKIPSKSDGF